MKAQAQRSFTRRLKLNVWRRESEDGVFEMSLSPGGKYLTTLHYSGKVCTWGTPGLQPLKSWRESEQPYSEDLSPELLENPQLRKQVKGLLSCLLYVMI